MHLAIDHGRLLAGAQIGDGLRPRRAPPPDRPCRGRRRRGRGRARDPAAPACRGGRRNRRTARGARRSAAPRRARGRQSPAATSASHSRTPTGLRRVIGVRVHVGSIPDARGADCADSRRHARCRHRHSDGELGRFARNCAGSRMPRQCGSGAGSAGYLRNAAIGGFGMARGEARPAGWHRSPVDV